MEMNQLLLFLLILCIINDYVTDVVVTWSDIIDQLYYFFGLMLNQQNFII